MPSALKTDTRTLSPPMGGGEIVRDSVALKLPRTNSDKTAQAERLNRAKPPINPDTKKTNQDKRENHSQQIRTNGLSETAFSDNVICPEC